MSDDKQLLETNQVCRYFVRGPHTIKAVDDVDLQVAEGEFLAVVGSSGSGKSTLLNLLAGLDRPTRGAIRFRGETLSDWNRRRLASYRATSVGMVFQSFNLLNHKTALENVAMALYFSDLPRHTRNTRAAEMLARLGLAERMDHRPSDLSGGEQQRVAVARALVKSPRVLFADEPTGNLDLENSQEIGKLLKELNHQGLTIVMVTHNLEIAREHSDRILTMHYGKMAGDEGEATA